MKTIEDLIKELSGVLGKTSEKLRLMYLFETNPEAKRLIEARIKVLHNRYFGSDNIIILPTPPADKAHGEYLLGAVQFNDKNLYSFGLRESELTQHTIITGRSGSGKSNCMLLLAKQFIEKKKPFLLFSFKREYRDLAQDFGCGEKDGLLVFTCGRQHADFRYNPLILPRGVDRESWINILIEAINTTYFAGEGVAALMRKGLTWVYDNYEKPKIKHLKDWLEQLKTGRGREPDWLSTTKRIIDALCYGALGNVLNSDNPIDLEKLLKKQTILEIDNFNDDDRSFLVQCILRWVYKYALENNRRNQCDFMLMVDEAHHLFLKKQTDITGKESYSDSILRMIRECSVGMVLADQHPSLLSLPAMGNTFTSITFNLKTQQDVNAVGNAMLMTEEQKDFIGRLPVGYAIVRLQDRWSEPFLIQCPKVKISETRMTDEQIAEKMKNVYPDICLDYRDTDLTQKQLIKEFKNGNSGMLSVINEGLEGNPVSPGVLVFPGADSIVKAGNAESAEKEEGAETAESLECAGYKECGKPIIACPVSEAKESVFDSRADEEELKKEFLMSILENPYWGTSRRYSELEISTRKGNIIKEKLVRDGYITPVLIHIRNNLMCLFDLTDKAKDYLRTLGCRILEHKKEGGMEHKFGVNYVEQLYRKNGYEIELEKPTKNGKFIDLVATKQNATGEKDEECIVVACQVETGKSDILENVEAAFEDGYTKVRMVATNYPAMIKIKKKLEGYKTKPGQSLQISYLLPKVD